MSTNNFHRDFTTAYQLISRSCRRCREKGGDWRRRRHKQDIPPRRKPDRLTWRPRLPRLHPSRRVARAKTKRAKTRPAKTKLRLRRGSSGAARRSSSNSNRRVRGRIVAFQPPPTPLQCRYLQYVSLSAHKCVDWREISPPTNNIAGKHEYALCSLLRSSKR